MKDTYFENLVEMSDPNTESDKHVLEIQLNPAHDIFLGHFPEKPVLPGVVMIEIVKRGLEKVINKKLQLQSSSNIKFLKMVLPEEHYLLDLHLDIKLEDKTYKVKSSLQKEGTFFFKERAIFIEG